ncbi:MAG: hypothetical protein ACOVKN_10570 [Arenimonas sp.]
MALAMVAGQAIGQTTTAQQDVTCIGNRSSNLTCTAGEFSTIVAFQAVGNTPPVCTAGGTITYNATVGLSGSNTNRYDVGFFVGQQGNDPRAATAGGICSASVVPTSILPSAPWVNLDTDSCADFPGSAVTSWTINNQKVQCVGNASGQLSIPYVVSYDQNAGVTATCSASNVVNGSPSKCNAGTAVLNVGVNPVLVSGYIELTKQTLPDGNAQSFSFTATAPLGVNLFTSTDGGTTITPVGSNTATVNLTDNNSVRIYMPVLPAAANRTLTITETLVNNWQSTASIVCSPVAGGGTPTVTVDNAARSISAVLNETNSANACVVTNTLRPRITLAKSVASRQGAADQFTVSASSAGLLYTDNSQTTIATPSATTSGVLTSASTTFRSTPGQSVTLTDAMAAGSTFALSRYNTSLTCTNAYTGPGATPAGSLPSGLAVSTYNFTPAPGDNITCTYTNTAKPTTIAISKISVGGTGTFSFSSSGIGTQPTYPNITTVTPGVAVTGAAQTVTPNFVTVLTEAPPSGGFTVTSINCTGLGTGGTQTVNTANRTVTLSAQAVSPGVTIICTFTNALPSADLSITKTNGVTTLVSGAATTYTVRVSNAGPDAATGAIISDPAVTGLNKTAVACSAAVGNKYVTAPSVAQLEGGTFALPALAVGEFYEITVTATVTATGY